jgi:hypothetical protein
LQHRQSGTDYHATINFLSTSSEIRFRVRDVFGAVDLFEIPVSSNIAAPQAGGAPAPWLEIYAQLQGAGGLTVLYRRSDQVNWTSTGLLAVTGGAGTDTRAHFGALVAGTTLQRWRAFNVANLIFSGLNDTGLLRGASIASTPLSLVDAGVMDTDEGGPARFTTSTRFTTSHCPPFSGIGLRHATTDGEARTRPTTTS